MRAMADTAPVDPVARGLAGAALVVAVLAAVVSIRAMSANAPGDLTAKVQALQAEVDELGAAGVARDQDIERLSDGKVP